MSEIIKTEAVVLGKINFGDSSNVISVFTKDHGKISLILKGGRSPKSRKSLIINPLNQLQIIYYNKPGRDLQILSEVSLINHYPKVKEDLEKMKYALSSIELIKELIPEQEANEKLFRGLVRVLQLLNDAEEYPGFYFGKYFLFFIKEFGFEFQLSECKLCGRKINSGEVCGYNFELGLLCSNCLKTNIESFHLSAELFNYFICLTKKQKVEFVDNKLIENSLVFMEKYLKFHHKDFKGLKSLQVFDNRISR
ncbi:MAG: DNA repair protein RecO [Ignavibacteriaceae bacterium]|nr:DNA repair protein RecO [Ignavibacteriaceae bacterium]